MKIRLGYACLPVTIDETSSSTLTYSLYKKLGKEKNIKLDNVIKSNFSSLKNILKYNISNDVIFFRMTSNLIPLGTHKNVKYEIFKRYKNEFLEIGNIIKENDLRVDIHLDPFCVLNSDKKEVVSSSINILNFNYNMYNAMKIKSILVMHIGSSKNSKKEAINRFENNFNLLPKKIQKILTLENDDKVYNITDTLNLCKKLKIPMVLDYHHYLCNNNNENIEDYIIDICNTWNKSKYIPKIHFSSPKNKKEFRTHNDYINVDEFINFIEKIKFIDRDIDIMIEAKKKDEALFRLIRQLKYKKIYKIKKNTIFLK